METSHKGGSQRATHNPNHAVTSCAIVDDSSVGNFVWVTITDSVNSGDREPEHSELVQMLREAIRKVHDNYIKALQHGHENWLADLKKVAAIEVEQKCNFVSWCRFPVYEVNFGWDKPAWACTVTPPIKNTAVLLGTKCGDGIEAWISTTEEDMASLECHVHLM